MIEIIETTTKEKPTHVVLNKKILRNNKGYTTLEEAKEEAVIEAVLWGSENVELVDINDLTCFVIVDETVKGGGESKANNKGKIL